jgi:hypothetical protein
MLERLGKRFQFHGLGRDVALSKQPPKGKLDRNLANFPSQKVVRIFSKAMG